MEFIPGLIVVIAIVWYFKSKGNKSNNNSEGTSIGRVLLWILVGIFFIVPVNAILDWTHGNYNKNASVAEIAGAIALMFVFLASVPDSATT